MMGRTTQSVNLVIIHVQPVVEAIREHFVQVAQELLNIEYPQLILLPQMINVIVFQDFMMIIASYALVAILLV
jgi:hypothetical protein